MRCACPVRRRGFLPSRALGTCTIIAFVAGNALLYGTGDIGGGFSGFGDLVEPAIRELAAGAGSTDGTARALVEAVMIALGVVGMVQLGLVAGHFGGQTLISSRFSLAFRCPLRCSSGR